MIFSACYESMKRTDNMDGRFEDIDRIYNKLYEYTKAPEQECVKIPLSNSEIKTLMDALMMCEALINMTDDGK